MPLYTIHQIAKWTGATAQLKLPDEEISDLITDSRKIRNSDRAMFIALEGHNHDGHTFIKGLIEKGVRNFLLRYVPEGLEKTEANFLLVPDVLASLQSMATAIRTASEAQIIAVTGSNGKTIIKEWLFHLLNSQARTYRSPKSYNSQLGVPLSVWPLSPMAQLGIFEAGISEPGEMERLEKILKPDIGIFSNIGSAHDANFASRKEKVLEKSKLFKDCKKVIYCSDHTELCEGIDQLPDASKWLSWSESDTNADLYIKGIHKSPDGSRIEGRYQGLDLEIEIPFSDAASCENAIHCWLCCLELKVDNTVLKQAFLELPSIAMRLEMKSSKWGSIFISDVYNSDPESLTIAFDFLHQQAPGRKKVLIISDLLQSGLENEVLYTQVAKMIASHGIDTIHAIGKDISAQPELFEGLNITFYPGTDDFVDKLDSLDLTDTAILLKGARHYRFEKIAAKLEVKSHETTLNIHLNNMVENLNEFRKRIGKEVKVMAMVKAFSYGSGSFEIASLLEYHKVDYLAVAYTDEGVELRKAGIQLPIMVLNPEPASFADVVEYQLEPEIYGLDMLYAFDQALGDMGADANYPIHIKLETGMHRLGFEESDLDELIEHLKGSSNIRVVSAFSHLAASDEMSKEDFTRGQIETYRSMSDRLAEELDYPFLRHILNSDGILHYPDAQFDMVRLGIGLYGITSNLEARRKLKVVSELKATVSQVKYLKPGDKVGYGLSFTADRDMKIATITIGYADGFRRSLSNGRGRVWIAGKLHRVIGRVCMDMCMVDVSDSDVRQGDEVEIFGEHISVYELATDLDTIPYEVMTGISQRVKRKYIFE